MTEQRQAEFSELSARAEEHLGGRKTFWPHHKLLLRLWHYPAFDVQVSWLVYNPLVHYQQSDSSVVREVKWDRPFDWQRFNNPMGCLKHGFSLEPTILHRQAGISPDEIGLKMANLKRIVLPVFIDDNSIGLDGESFGIETFGCKSAVRFTWWSEGCAEWKPIVDWAEDMRRFIGECLESQPLISRAI